MRIIKPENNGSCLEEASSLAKLHNRALSMLLRKLEEELKGFRYSFLNFNINLRKRMNHPSKYGMYLHAHSLCHIYTHTYSKKKREGILMNLKIVLKTVEFFSMKVSRKGKGHAVGQGSSEECSAVEERD
jgi:hypothetical protein